MSLLTANEVITDVRGQLSDDSAGTERWSNAVLYRYIYDGELEIAGNHPEVQYNLEVAAVAPTLCTATGDSLTIITEYKLAIVHYVCKRCLAEDADDAANMNLAKYHENEMKKALGEAA